MTLLTATDLRKQFGPRHVLDGATFTLDEGEHAGIVGVNGSGKSTLLRILAGVDYPESGTVAVRRGAIIGYLAQDPVLDETRTIRQEMEAALAAHQTALAAYQDVTRRLEHPGADDDLEALMAKLEALQHQIDHLGGYDLSHRIEGTLHPLGIVDPDRPVQGLSGGERKRVAIAKVLLQQPDILILDEPTNHLDADTVLWLEDQLGRYPGGVLLVTHDRYFLDHVVSRILEVAEGKLTSYPGKYADYLEAKAEELAQAERAEENRQNLLRTEIEWLRRGPKARTTKSRSRIDRAEALMEQKGPARAEAAKIDFGDPARLGHTILRLEHVHKALGGRTLVRDLGLDLEKGERIGIIGPNGSGKTTLLKMILGEVAPDRGKVVLGQNTSILYFDQNREALDPEKTIREEVADQGDIVEVAGRRMHIVTYLEEFLFPPGVHRMPIRSLSGGERNRVVLARLMKRRSNLLILDEPTNDLDLLTLQVLEAALARFQGCVLCVTHDRFFLNKVATSILAFEGDGQVVRYVGDYDTYRSLKEQRDRAEAEARARAAAAGTGTGAKGGIAGASGAKGAGPGGAGGKGAGSAGADGKGAGAAGGGAKAEVPVGGDGKGAAPGGAASGNAAAQGGGKAKKLTWAEQRELEALPGKIEALEAAVASIEAQLADPGTFSNAVKVRELSEALSGKQAELETLYARWEELEGRQGG